MAAGDSKLSNEYSYQLGLGTYNQSTDDFRIYFCSDTFASIDEDAATLDLSDVTQVGGGNFPIAGLALSTVSWARSGAVSTLDYADLTTIAKDVLNPVGIRTAIIVNDSSASDDIYKIVDLTANGTTAIDVVNNDFDYSVNASGSSKLTVV